MVAFLDKIKIIKKMKNSIYLFISTMFLLTSCGTMGIASTPSNYQKSGQEVSA
tara:strand:+ start:122 stop:280 length:159 start_codon:yes stop_codon:yes gene_type:complete